MIYFSMIFESRFHDYRFTSPVQSSPVQSKTVHLTLSSLPSHRKMTSLSSQCPLLLPQTNSKVRGSFAFYFSCTSKRVQRNLYFTEISSCSGIWKIYSQSLMRNKLLSVWNWQSDLTCCEGKIIYATQLW